MNEVPEGFLEIPLSQIAKEQLKDSLQRLVRLRKDFEEHLNPLGVEMLDRSIESRAKDLRSLGFEKEVQESLDQLGKNTQSL